MDKSSHELVKLANTRMPFGKYKGHYLIELPEHYIVWYHNKGFPKNALGKQLQLIYELQLNGLECLLKPLKEK